MQNADTGREDPGIDRDSGGAPTVDDHSVATSNGRQKTQTVAEIGDHEIQPVGEAGHRSTDERPRKTGGGRGDPAACQDEIRSESHRHPAGLKLAVNEESRWGHRGAARKGGTRLEMILASIGSHDGGVVLLTQAEVHMM
jgi:hypothetical protein